MRLIMPVLCILASSQAYASVLPNHITTQVARPVSLPTSGTVQAEVLPTPSGSTASTRASRNSTRSSWGQQSSATLKEPTASPLPLGRHLDGLLIQTPSIRARSSMCDQQSISPNAQKGDRNLHRKEDIITPVSHPCTPGHPKKILRT